MLHALLILCLWPVTKLREAYDPSWTYIGIAIQGAVNMDLHVPAQTRGLNLEYIGLGDFAISDTGLRTRLMTWLSCFDIGIRYISRVEKP